MDWIWHKDIEHRVQMAFSHEMSPRLCRFPSAKVLSIKECIVDVFTRVRFSSDVVCEVMAGRGMVI
ncbi:hypothetical protein [Alicyclobacillus fastidiosus]|uniref:hypothetical protein n=1 Tax=Alicyclobacillus fastidiosus TaxID=392011 RepID=UPI0023B8764F|nr:hypothetical protein [Alicyclobacillus fastidiosus]WEH10920.1 hypothetical protein PYS47_06805 [Alicyclobacillus fastidiosus]